jgi:hypothetical protein
LSCGGRGSCGVFDLLCEMLAVHRSCAGASHGKVNPSATLEGVCRKASRRSLRCAARVSMSKVKRVY